MMVPLAAAEMEILLTSAARMSDDELTHETT